MALRVIQGPPNSGRAGEVLARMRAALDREPVLVVPTGDDVAAFERELCAAGEATIGATISTFSALNLEVARALAVELPPKLTVAQRQALVRAAIGRAAPRLMRRSAVRPGFAPALDRLIAELQAALISPAELRTALADLDDPAFESELCDLYLAYTELRDASARGDDGTIAAAVIEAVRRDATAWGQRPVLIYGFDDLTRAQLELVAALASTTEVGIAVTYDDRRALSVRAGLVATLTEELGVDEVTELPFADDYTESATLRHLDRNLFEPEAETVELDAGLTLLESTGARGEAESIAIEIARLLRDGTRADEIAIVVRHPENGGPLLANVLRDLGIPVALEASQSLAATTVGTSLIALCRAHADERDTGALLTHLRCDPSQAPDRTDWVERRIRRGDAQTVDEAVEPWSQPPKHLQRLREAASASDRLRSLARSARGLAEAAHRERAPLAERSAGDGAEPPFSALELRAGVAAAELLSELATIGSLEGCEQPDVAEAVEALRSATVPLWRGPAEGRVRIMSPYRARAARVKALFCASLHDGEFPSSAAPDPLLAEERRRELGIADLRRSEPAEEERYLFHACVSRPTERLYLSWQACDEDGTAIARSPFVDDVLDLLEPGAAHEQPIRRRGPERTVLSAEEATTPRALARALALGGWKLEREPVLTRLAVAGDNAAATLAQFDGVPDPCALPGPLRAPAVLADLGARDVFSANSLEGWVTCPYKWFVEHELSPQRLEPLADPLWLGSMVHDSLEALYRDPPGEDSIPRPGDIGRWIERFGELLERTVTESSGARLNPGRRAAVDRARVQVEAFLRTEAESESTYRPDRALLEVSFGPFDPEDEAERPALVLGDGIEAPQIKLRGRIDRIDIGPDGHTAIVRDYKTAKSVTPADKFTEKGTLQIQLYMRAVRDVLELHPVGGLYQPLGAADPGKRRPRGVFVADDPGLEAMSLVGRDRREDPELEEILARAEETALGAAAEMRAGKIGRRPIGDQCPKYCTFQPICRLERAVGAVGDEGQNGSDE